jgi:hypothetical protein
MNQEIKQKWVEALRSKKYKQGRGVLRRKDTYCCLGVLCDLNEKVEWKFLASTRLIEEQYIPSISPDNAFGDFFIPIEISEWAELSDVSSEVLVELNDDKFYSFEQIADYIEENL